MEKEILKKQGIKWCNTYYECDEYVMLNCSKEETNESYNIFIDKEDFELVSQGQWFVWNRRKDTNLKDIYSVIWTKKSKGNQTNYEIHQLILGTQDKKNMIVDHINNNRFDNRRKNLRIVDAQINRINQKPRQLGWNKKMKDRVGYNYDKQTGKYLTRVSINKKEVNIGRYKTELEAEVIYLKACIVLGYDKISKYIKDRIEELHIKLNESEIITNKYLNKVFILSLKN